MSPSAHATGTLPRGFIPVMLTPFQDSGAVDYAGLSRLTQLYLEAGAAGLFANCLSSEMYELTPQERIDVTRHVVEEAGRRVPVVATGTFGGAITGQADFIKRLYDTGVQAIIVTTCQLLAPYEPDNVLLSRMHQLMELTDNIPLGLYECPVPYKRLINADILAELLPTGRLIYHKDTSLDAQEVSRRLQVAQGYRFGLYDAYMVNAVSSLRAGAAGLSCIQGNYFPELVVWLCQHYDNPARREEVDRVQQLMTDCMDLVHTAYPTLPKYSLQKRGLSISRYTRRKVEPLTSELMHKMDGLHETVEQLQAELGIVPVQPAGEVKSTT